MAGVMQRADTGKAKTARAPKQARAAAAAQLPDQP
jgi:hypothetical protein